MEERILRELRRQRHINLPNRPRVIAWDLDGTLIENGDEGASQFALENLWTRGFTNIITTASTQEYAQEQIAKRDWHPFINRIYGQTISGEGKSYLPVIEDMKLTPEEIYSNLLVVGDSIRDIPADIMSVFVLSNKPRDVYNLIEELWKKENFLEGFLSAEYNFKPICYSRLHDNKKMPVLSDESIEVQIAA